MFLDYFQLREQPFALAGEAALPNPSPSHHQVLESLLDSLLHDRGHLALIADSGMGKTTLLGELYSRLLDAQRPAGLFPSNSTCDDILNFLLQGVHIDSTGLDCAGGLRKLQAVWFAEMLAGKRFVLLFDDAESLNAPELDTLRQLSKFETSNSKFVQIVLCGQPTLSQNLDRNNCASLRNRLSDAYHLPPYSVQESAAYIQNRLRAAGYLGDTLFASDAVEIITQRSSGNPKSINKICSRALLEAYARGMHTINAEMVEKAERNLTTVPTIAAASMGAPQPKSSSASQAQFRRPRPELTYRKPMQFGIPGSGVWVGAVLGVLLSAGLALPHGMFKGVTQMIRGTEVPIASTVPVDRPIELSTVTNGSKKEMPEKVPAATVRPSKAKSPDPRFVQIHPKADTATGTSSELSLTRELGLKINRIVIDPGHGGFDTGAKGPNGLLEKDLCLDVALRLGRMIEENIPSAEVIYTRKDDTYIALDQRTAMANAAGADLFISIHANSSDSRDVRGVETYYLSLATSKEAKELAIRENALTQSSLHDLPDIVRKITQNEKLEESKRLAAQIQDTLSERLQIISQREKNRGVKQAPFIVLAGADMPAVLSEISFVSNANDETLLMQTAQRQRIAQGLYRGISAYLDGLHGATENKQKLVTDNRISVDHHAEPSGKSLFD